MSRGARTQLAEILQLIDGERIARQVQQRVQQHRAVAVREHEAVAVPPFRIAGVVLEHVAPQHFGNVGHAHGRAGMSRIRGLYGIHGERANGIGQGAAGGGCGWGIHKGRALSDRREPGGNRKPGKSDPGSTRRGVVPEDIVRGRLDHEQLDGRSSAANLAVQPDTSCAGSPDVDCAATAPRSRGRGAQARSASTTHLSDSSGVDTRITLRIAKPGVAELLLELLARHARQRRAADA